ncbi:cytochrome P450 [Castilleja foliolosa]|uniref:Cytochrome P450 n=1 Tax=Castilleja foliolosa TaxID=1961234 RepID=A0ABD3CB18_9LAMI
MEVGNGVGKCKIQPQMEKGPDKYNPNCIFQPTQPKEKKKEPYSNSGSETLILLELAGIYAISTGGARSCRRCAKQLVEKLKPDILNGSPINMEEKFSELTLDIIGLSLLNYNFDSLTTNSSVIDSVYTALKEAELRSTYLLPYWKVQIMAEKAVALIRQTVEELIAKYKEIVESESERIYEDYVNHADPGILRFLLASREEVMKPAAPLLHPKKCENESKEVLHAFFVGKALGEALNERLESSVGEFLSIVGQFQAEQQKQLFEFQDEVLEKARRAKEEASREAAEARGLVSTVDGVSKTTSFVYDSVTSTVLQGEREAN